MYLLPALALLAGSSCSLIFDSKGVENEEPRPGEFDLCEGRGRTYSRGPAAAGFTDRFRHVDLRQGTLTFWVRALQPIEQDTPLVSLGGILIAVLADGTLGIKLGDDTDIVVDDFDWTPGEDHFVALRWDTTHALSGYNAETPNVDIRVDGAEYRYIIDALAIPPAADDTLYFGFGAGRFHVDQAVIYDRPLYVDDDSNVQSDLTLMAVRKSTAPFISGGGFDVLLATVSPKNEGCEEHRAEAWAFRNTGLLTGDLKLGVEGKLAGSFRATNPATAWEQVYPEGGIVVSAGTAASVLVPINKDGSYVLEVLFHTATSTVPIIEVEYIRDGGDVLALRYEGPIARRSNPHRATLPFQASSSDTQIRISLAASGDGPIAFDSLSLRANSILDPGFEGVLVDGKSPWSRQPENPIEYDLVSPYAGERSACLVSEEAPDVMLQAPQNMDDDKLYLFGAQMLWAGNSETPTINVGNGSLFAVGEPYESRRKASASARDSRDWQNLATVGRRNKDTTKDNHNDLIRFGTGYKTGGSDFCLDSAYNIELDRILGTPIVTP